VEVGGGDPQPVVRFVMTLFVAGVSHLSFVQLFGFKI
jgi:hypothetical protein